MPHSNALISSTISCRSVEFCSMHEMMRVARSYFDEIIIYFFTNIFFICYKNLLSKVFAFISIGSFSNIKKKHKLGDLQSAYLFLSYISFYYCKKKRK